MTEVTASRRAWSSGLSTNDFAACVAAGFEPLGFVQGCSVVSWSFFGVGYSAMGLGFGGGRPSGYYEQYACPHGMVSADHRQFGLNFEKTWIEQAWAGARDAALTRLTHEAKELGAHGIIDIIDKTIFHPDSSTFEFSLSGTAVAVEGADAPTVPFTTFLAGQKLNKLIEAGFAPVAIALGIAAVGVMSSCITEYQLRGVGYPRLGGVLGGAPGGWGVPQGEVEQVARAHAAARSIVRERVRSTLGGDILHGARLEVTWQESQEGPQIDATIHGNRVRRFKPFAQMDPPRPVVRLVDR